MTLKYAVISDVHGPSRDNLEIRIFTNRRKAENQSRTFRELGYQSFVCQLDTLNIELERCKKIIERQKIS